jgi:hypothetical protein
MRNYIQLQYAVLIGPLWYKHQQKTKGYKYPQNEEDSNEADACLWLNIKLLIYNIYL